MKLEEMKAIADARTHGDGWDDFHKMCHHNFDAMLKVIEIAKRLDAYEEDIGSFPWKELSEALEELEKE